MSPSAAYELRVEGHLDDHWSTWLGGPDLVRTADGTTVLTGRFPDQAALHGVLTRLSDIGASLLSLQVRHDVGTRVVRSALDRPVRTQRLTLRPATAADAAATFRYRSLESVGQWLTELPLDPAAYDATFSDPDRLAATVVVELDGHVIGDFMLRVEDAWAQAEVADQARAAQAELGWVLDPAYAGRGLATEAVRELIRVCFEDLRLHRVHAECFADNESSWRLMERVGMRREVHAVADSLHRSGRWSDTLGYALLADEWQTQRTREGRHVSPRAIR